MAERGVEALIATSPQNVYYVADYWSRGLELGASEAYAILPLDGDPLLIAPVEEIDLIVEGGALFESLYLYGPPGFEVSTDWTAERTGEILRLLESSKIYVDAPSALSAALRDMNPVKRIALDSSGLSPQSLEALRGRLGDVEVVEGLGLLREMRMVKTLLEVEMLRRATEVLEKAMEDTLEIIASGVSEMEASGMFRYSLASDGGVETLIHLGFGERSSYPNPIPSTLEAARGDVIRLRLGCTLSHYHSRVSRTAILGRPRKELRGVWEAILSAQDVALEALEPGASASEVYEKAERALREGGLRGLGLSIGSGIGLEAYEPPRIGRGSDEELLEGMVIALDVRYLKLGSYGVELEDLYHIAGDGAEPLTRTSRDLYLL
ncbi:aminopeptidase P family protein [Candidatus Bathyarchaeota archaeon]|nr:aminopeptidase P family protein [Candidatus Bathyarchaeota archaeon]